MLKRVTAFMLLVTLCLLSLTSVGLAKNYPRHADQHGTDHPWGGDDNNSPEGDGENIIAGPVAPYTPHQFIYVGGNKGSFVVYAAEFLWGRFTGLFYSLSTRKDVTADRQSAHSTSLEETGNPTSAPKNGGKVGR